MGAEMNSSAECFAMHTVLGGDRDEGCSIGGIMPRRVRAMCLATRAGVDRDGEDGSVLLADSCTNVHT